MLIWNILILEKSLEEQLLKDDFQDTWNTRVIDKINHLDSVEALKKVALKAVRFSSAITKSNGNVCSCGDQDSGRYIKLGLSGKFQTFKDLKNKDYQIKHGHYDWEDEEELWLENDLDQRYLLMFFDENTEHLENLKNELSKEKQGRGNKNGNFHKIAK